MLAASRRPGRQASPSRGDRRRSRSRPTSICEDRCAGATGVNSRAPQSQASGLGHGSRQNSRRPQRAQRQARLNGVLARLVDCSVIAIQYCPKQRSTTGRQADAGRSVGPPCVPPVRMTTTGQGCRAAVGRPQRERGARVASARFRLLRLKRSQAELCSRGNPIIARENVCLRRTYERQQVGLH